MLLFYLNTDNPRQHGKGLTGTLSQYWRYRIGDYRILAEINDTEIVIIIVEAGHRRDIYRYMGTIQGTNVDGVSPPYNFHVCTLLTSSSPMSSARVSLGISSIPRLFSCEKLLQNSALVLHFSHFSKKSHGLLRKGYEASAFWTFSLRSVSVFLS